MKTEPIICEGFTEDANRCEEPATSRVTEPSNYTWNACPEHAERAFFAGATCHSLTVTR